MSKKKANLKRGSIQPPTDNVENEIVDFYQLEQQPQQKNFQLERIMSPIEKPVFNSLKTKGNSEPIANLERLNENIDLLDDTEEELFEESQPKQPPLLRFKPPKKGKSEIPSIAKGKGKKGPKKVVQNFYDELLTRNVVDTPPLMERALETKMIQQKVNSVRRLNFAGKKKPVKEFGILTGDFSIFEKVSLLYLLIVSLFLFSLNFFFFA